MIPTPYRNHSQFIEIRIPLIFSSFVILMPPYIQYHLLNNLIGILWCGVIIQPLRSICLPLQTAFYSVFFVFVHYFSVTKGSRMEKWRWRRQREGRLWQADEWEPEPESTFFCTLINGRWLILSKKGKKMPDRCYRWEIQVTNDSVWEPPWVEGRWGWHG